MSTLIAMASRIDNSDIDLDGYNRRGVTLSRDAAHLALIATRQYWLSLYERRTNTVGGSEANIALTEEMDRLDTLMAGMSAALQS
jgi:hypothetical protein